jgi:DNA-binding MarR family transcriptional regulator
VARDAEDRRRQRLVLTHDGRTLVTRAYALWQRAHAELEESFTATDLKNLRRSLLELARMWQYAD